MKKVFEDDTSYIEIVKDKDNKFIISLCIKEENNQVVMISSIGMEKDQLLNIIENNLSNADMGIQKVDEKEIVLYLSTVDKNETVTISTPKIAKEELVSLIVSA